MPTTARNARAARRATTSSSTAAIPNSKLLIVSERPGDNEDVMGQAFVGRSGELLDKIMASIGLDTNRDLLIVNVVKCKAEIDRAPSAQEVEACFPICAVRSS
jgi:uracil-DNA glycosylase family 4